MGRNVSESVSQSVYRNRISRGVGGLFWANQAHPGGSKPQSGGSEAYFAGLIWGPSGPSRAQPMDSEALLGPITTRNNLSFATPPTFPVKI